MFPNQVIKHSGETETMIFVEICDMNDPEIESQWFLIKRNSGLTFFKMLGSSPYSVSYFRHLVLGDFNQFRPGNLCGSFKLKKIVKTATRGENVVDQVYTNLSFYYYNLPSYLLLARPNIVLLYYNRFVTKFLVHLP